MNEDRFTSENAWYHFAIQDIRQAISIYGIDVVMTDIYDALEEHRQANLPND